MNGLNKRYKKGPKKFLGEFAVQEMMELETAKPPPGVYEFDFQPTPSPTTVLFGTPRPVDDPGEELIRAYWLPWKRRETLQLQLGPGVDYFFTAHMDGCELRTVPPAGKGTYIKVLHIAGDIGGKTGEEWRAKQAADALTPSELQRSQAFSSTEPPPNGYAGHSDVQVFGFKKNNSWQLWAQVTDEKATKVSDHWRIY